MSFEREEMIDFPRIRVWPRPIGVVIAPTENCQTLTPEQAERLAADLIRAAYDARKLSPCPPPDGAPAFGHPAG